MNSVELLEVSHLTVSVGGPDASLRPVRDVSLRVERGEVLGIVGESGSGKTMLTRAILGLLPPGVRVGNEAQICLDGVDLTELGPAELRQYWGPRLALVPQDPGLSLNPVRKIGAHLMDCVRRDPRVAKADRERRIIELLTRVGIADPARRMNAYPHQLSGGMRQRVLIAMAVALAPDLLIADEPTTALDVTVQGQVLDLIDELRSSSGTSVILISHDLSVIEGRCDRVAVMYGGRVVEIIPGGRLRSSRHPYSRGLMDCHPTVDMAPRIDLATIQGEPPTLPLIPATGCTFAPRCDRRQAVCAEVTPELSMASSGDAACACHFPLTEGALA